MVWSGLRGAVSLAMAIIVDLEPAITPQMGSRIMFHVGGVAALTFIINASTAPYLLKWLGLTRASRARSQVLRRLAQHMDSQTMEACEKQLANRKDTRFNCENISLVQEMMHQEQSDDEGAGDTGGGASSAADAAASSVAVRDMLQSAGVRRAETADMDVVDGADQEEVDALASVHREIWLRMVQHHYWGAIGEGVIPRTLKVARTLLHSTDEALDSSWKKLNDWEVIARDITVDGAASPFMQFCSSCRPFSWIPDFKRSFSEDFRIMQTVYVVLSFLEAHAYAQEEMKKYLSSRDPVATEVIERVASESEEQRQMATAMLGQLKQEYVQLGKSEMLARKLLQEQLAHVGHMEESGLLTPSEASNMTHKVLMASRKIINAPKESWLNKPSVRISRASLGKITDT